MLAGGAGSRGIGAGGASPDNAALWVPLPLARPGGGGGGGCVVATPCTLPLPAGSFLAAAAAVRVTYFFAAVAGGPSVASAASSVTFYLDQLPPGPYRCKARVGGMHTHFVLFVII